LAALRILNLSHNQLFSLRGVASLPLLENLAVEGNFLGTAESIAEIALCPALSNLDLSDNKLKELDEGQDEGLPNTLASYQQVFSQTQLRCLRMVGNPLIRQVPNYRVAFHGLILTLTYFDDRPVTEDDHAIGTAFLEGGREAEKRVREEIRARKIRVKEEAREEIRATLDDYRFRKMQSFKYYLE
jgi:dynein assembly factor 1